VSSTPPLLALSLSPSCVLVLLHLARERTSTYPTNNTPPHVNIVQVQSN